VPAPLAIARLLGAGLLSATEVSASRALLAAGGDAEMLFKGEAEDAPEDITIPVSSSAIRTIGWRKDGIIIVEFVRGGVYTYDGTYELFKAFITAPSKGGFFNANFK